MSRRCCATARGRCDLHRHGDRGPVQHCGERGTCLGGEVAAGLELLEEGRHEDGGEEEDHAPEEHVRDEGAVGSAGRAHKVPVQRLALLLTPEDTVMMRMMMVGMEEDRGGGVVERR